MTDTLGGSIVFLLQGRALQQKDDRHRLEAAPVERSPLTG